MLTNFFSSDLLKVGLFLFSNGSEIVEFTADQIEEALEFGRGRYEEGKAFLDKMIEKYRADEFRAEAAFFAAAANGPENTGDIAARCEDAGIGYDKLCELCATEPERIRLLIELLGERAYATSIPDDFEQGATVDAKTVGWHMEPQSVWSKIWEMTDGSGEYVFVNDTGTSPDHPDIPTPKHISSIVPGEPSGIDRQSHGTHCSGTAVGQNGIGAAPGADFGAIQCLSSAGRGLSSWTAASINRALDLGATVISLSIGGGGPDEGTRRALVRAKELGCIVVAAAGNDGYQGRDSVNNPAKDANAAAIAAYRRDGLIAVFSSGGPDVDIAFPGQDIISANFQGGRVSFSGTSMATPMAAGFAALVQSFLVKNGFARLRDTAEFIEFCSKYATDAGAPGEDNRFGAGILNIFETLSGLRPDDVQLLSDGRKTLAAKVASAIVAFVACFLFTATLFAQDSPQVETVVQTIEITTKFYDGKPITEPNQVLIGEVRTVDAATVFEMPGAEKVVLIGSDLQPTAVDPAGEGLFLVDTPGEYLVFPYPMGEFKRITVEAPEPDFDTSSIESRARELADQLNDPATRKALSESYRSVANDTSLGDLSTIERVVKERSLAVFATRTGESRFVDWVNGFQRPLQADIKALGHETVDEYRAILNAVSDGLDTQTPAVVPLVIPTEAATVTSKVYEWRDVQVDCGNGGCRIERRLVEVK